MSKVTAYRENRGFAPVVINIVIDNEKDWNDFLYDTGVLTEDEIIDSHVFREIIKQVQHTAVEGVANESKEG